MKNIIVALFLVSSILANAQIIKGKVSDVKGKALAFANVFIKGTKKGTTTNEKGLYELQNIDTKKVTIVVSFTGFISRRKTIIIKSSEDIIVNFQLQEDGNLDEIVVSGTLKPVKKLESPVPVEVYSPTFFIKNPTPSVFESMQNVNGVRPQVNCSVCNTGDIHINGLEGPYSFVMIDGMPIVSGLSTVYGLTGIPQSLIQKVEIVKGPASTLYGSEAVGGIINIITKDTKRTPKLSFETFGSSWGEVNVDIGTKYTLGKKVDGILGTNYFNYQNPIDNNKDGFTDLTQQHRISVFNKFNFKRKSNKVFTIAGRYMYEDRWGGQMNWEKKYRGGNQVYGESIYTNRWEAFGTYQLPTVENINFQFSANGHHQNSFYGDTPFNAEQYIGFGQLTWNKPLKAHDILVGAAYRYTFYDDDTFATDKKASITYLPGIFVQDEITLAPQNKLLVGLRYDHNNIHGNIFSPRLNYKWNSKNNNDIIRISLGNGFRVANVFTEDHAALTGSRTVVFEEDLEPETSWNSNINYTKRIITENGTFINFDASSFYTYFNNKIIPNYDNPNQIRYGNLENGNAISKGISINSDVTWQNGLSIIAGATLMDVSTTENGVTERQQLTESFSGTWSVSYNFRHSGYKLDYTGNVYGPMDLPLLAPYDPETGTGDPRSPTSPWYSIQNIQLTKTFNNGMELFGGVKNLLNFTPAANSILNADNPFEKGVNVDTTPEKAFDPAYVYASNQGIRGFLGFRYTLK